MPNKSYPTDELVDEGIFTGLVHEGKVCGEDTFIYQFVCCVNLIRNHLQTPF